MASSDWRRKIGHGIAQRRSTQRELGRYLRSDIRFLGNWAMALTQLRGCAVIFGMLREEQRFDRNGAVRD